MSLNPIVLDLEMSGLFPTKKGIWQIGAVDLNTMEEYLDESKIDGDDEVDEEALKVIGKTEEELRDSTKQSQKEMLEKFFDWVGQRQMRNMLCQNPQFDVGFLYEKAQKYGLRKTVPFRSFDLHTVAQIKYHELNGRFKTEGDHSTMNLKSILEFCGLPDKRIQIVDGEVVQEGNPHNALEDAKLTAECFSRIIKGENLFEEYSQYPVPDYLSQGGKK